MVRNDKGGADNPSSQQTKNVTSDVNSRKRNMTLDLNPTKSMSKRTKLELSKSVAPMLSSPDINMFKLATPEVEKLLIHSGMTATPTPSTSQILFPTSVTEEQEKYARGFVDALNELHGSDSSEGCSQSLEICSNSSSNSMNYTDLMPGVSRQLASFSSSPPLGILIKEEAQTVPSLCASPLPSPINMENQEMYKLERKRQRNRLAASKCRKRKLERIAKLEDKVKQLKGENSDLSTVLVRLKSEVCLLKEKVMEHHNSGCQIMMASQYC